MDQETLKCSCPQFSLCAPGHGRRSPCRWKSVRAGNDGGVLLSEGRLHGVQELLAHASAHSLHNRQLKIDEGRAWNVFSSTCSGEESVERVLSSTEGLITWRLTFRLSAVFETVQLPACVAPKIRARRPRRKRSTRRLLHRWSCHLASGRQAELNATSETRRGHLTIAPSAPS